MDTTQRIKAATATLMVGFLLAIAFAATAQAKPVPAPGVAARAEAINQHYQLGLYGPVASAKLDQLRDQAINNFYGIGTSSAAAVQKADEARAQAMNRFYNVGNSAVGGTSSWLDWGNAGIGVGGMLGLILLAAGLTVVVRHRTAGQPSSPSTI